MRLFVVLSALLRDGIQFLEALFDWRVGWTILGSTQGPVAQVVLEVGEPDVPGMAPPLHFVRPPPKTLKHMVGEVSAHIPTAPRGLSRARDAFTGRAKDCQGIMVQEVVFQAVPLALTRQATLHRGSGFRAKGGGDEGLNIPRFGQTAERPSSMHSSSQARVPPKASSVPQLRPPRSLPSRSSNSVCTIPSPQLPSHSTVEMVQSLVQTRFPVYFPQSAQVEAPKSPPSHCSLSSAWSTPSPHHAQVEVSMLPQVSPAMTIIATRAMGSESPFSAGSAVSLSRYLIYSRRITFEAFKPPRSPPCALFTLSPSSS